MYDLDNILSKQTDRSYFLRSAEVGIQGHIDYSRANERIVYMSSFNELTIIPVPHRNTISFIGMEPRVKYLATRVLGDKFIALHANGSLYTYSILSGKLLGVWNFDDLDDPIDWT